MFIVAKKVHRSRLVAGVAVLSLVFVLGAMTHSLTQTIHEAQTIALKQASPKGIKTNEDRIRYLESYGWELSEEAASVEEVLIPKEFDPGYDAYLSLQQSQGFDLEQYAGKTVKRYTYQITNYPGLQENIWAALLVYKKTVIGGEVFCNAGDGFTQSLAYPTGEG